MLRALKASTLAALALLAATGCPAPTPPTAHVAGSASAAPAAAWKPRSFSRATEGCTQTWACDCSALAAKPGCHLDATSDTSTEGACAADSGPVNGCTRCLALPPAPACDCKNVCP